MSLALCALVAVTALQGQTRFGAPSYWAWVLTGIQVLALWAAGEKRSWGWLLGASVQPVWITYAIFTGQLGFIQRVRDLRGGTDVQLRSHRTGGR